MCKHVRHIYLTCEGEPNDSLTITAPDAQRKRRHEPARNRGWTRSFAGRGDFADGAIAYEGNWLGADTFVNFDEEAVSLFNSQGLRATLLS
jgi:hypothetical protein